MSGPGLAAGRGSVRRRAARPPAPRGWEGLTLTEVPGPDVVLAARRPQVTAVDVLAVGPPRPGHGPRPGQLQPRLLPGAWTAFLLTDQPSRRSRAQIRR
jgi:hypothetical protein